MNETRKSAAHSLLKTGTIVLFRVVDTQTELSPDKENVFVRAELVFEDDEEDTDPGEIVEWAAFGFLFTLGALSFHDARPRGISEIYYQPNDEFTVTDFIDSLSFKHGELRLRTDGRCSLDDVMHALWQEYGAGDGVPRGAFERIAEETSGLRLDEFFEQYLRGTADPPIGILLAQFAVRLRLRGLESAKDAGGKAGKREDRPLPWLGAAIREDGGRVLVASVLSDGPGLEAGLSAGDEIVAIGGERCRPERFDAMLDELTVGEPAAVHVFRRDDLRELSLRPARPPRDTAWLELDDDADDASRERRLAWLGV